MAIIVKIKPQMITAKTKDALLRRLSGGLDFRNGSSSAGGYLFRRSEGRDGGTVRLYSLEKHNTKKRVDVRTITRGKRKGEVERTVTILKDSHWVAHYYDVPKDLVKHAQQGTRTFELKLK